MKKMLTILLIIFGILTVPKFLYSYAQKGWEKLPNQRISFKRIPRALEKPVQTLLRCPPAKELLAHLQLQGKIDLVYADFGENGSNAMWKGDTRQIVINASKPHSTPAFLRSILFEMHNASAHDRFTQTDSMARQNQIHKEAYVRKIEQMEHQNALKTMTLIDWAIKNNYFPRETSWNIVRNFEDHYKVQQLTGHAQFIASVYDGLNPRGRRTAYKGTITPRLFSSSQKQQMLTFFSLKDKLEHGSPHEKSVARNTLMNLGKISDLALMQQVFRGTEFYDALTLDA